MRVPFWQKECKILGKRKRQQPSEQDLIVYTTHEAGHAVVGHMIGRLIDEVLP
jgi:hypothetical protein